MGQLAEVLENGSDEVSAIVRICKEGRNEVTQWKDISANDYIYRPRDLEALCFYQQSMYYAKGYKKDGLSNDAGAETKQMAFEKGHPGVNFAYLSKLKRVRIPNVSLPDGSLCRIEELRVNDDAPSEEVKKKRENYAKMALLMFCPFRGENGLDVLKGNGPKGIVTGTDSMRSASSTIGRWAVFLIKKNARRSSCYRRVLLTSKTTKACYRNSICI